MANRFPQEMQIRQQDWDAIQGPPTRSSVFLDFFSANDLNHFTATVSNSTAPTAVADGSPTGTVTFTNAEGDNDFISWQSKQSFKFTPGERLSFGIRVRISDATNADLFIGFAPTDTSVIAGVGGGVYLLKADDAATVDLVSNVGGSATVEGNNIDTVVADTYIEYTCHIYVTGEGKADILVMADGENIYFEENVTVSASSQEQRFTFCLQNGAAAAKSGIVDWLFWDVPRG